MVVSEQSPETFLQPPPCVVEPAHHRALRTVEHRADLRVGEPVHFAQEYDGAVFRGQLTHGGTEPFRDLGVAGPLEREVLQRPIGERKGGVLAAIIDLERHRPPLRVTPLMIQTEVVGDAVDPRVEGRVALEAVEALVRPGEGLLHDIQSILAVAEHPERERSDTRLVTLDQLAEGIPVARPDSLDEVPVARRHDALESETRRLAPYSGGPWSVRLRPVGTVAHIHPEGTPRSQTRSMASRMASCVRPSSAS